MATIRLQSNRSICLLYLLKHDVLDWLINETRDWMKIGYISFSIKTVTVVRVYMDKDWTAFYANFFMTIPSGSDVSKLLNFMCCTQRCKPEVNHCTPRWNRLLYATVSHMYASVNISSLLLIFTLGLNKKRKKSC